MKLVGVKVKKVKKVDGDNWPDVDAMCAFEKEYRAAWKEFGDGHWSVQFYPEDFGKRTIHAGINGPLNFAQHMGLISIPDMKKELPRYRNLAKELEQAIAYAEKKHAELEKKFKALPAQENRK